MVWMVVWFLGSWSPSSLSLYRYTFPFSLCLVSFLLTLLQRVVYTPQFFFLSTLAMMKQRQKTSDIQYLE
jgi:hypothetical protein